MSVNIYCARFTKRRNSTARPAAFDVDYACYLKERCDFNRPVFQLNASDFPYNYVRWGNSYYFVTSVAYIKNNLLEVSCEIDALATYKNEILASQQFVLYDTTPNEEISDSRLSLKTITSRNESVGSSFDFLGRGFSVALNVVGENSCCCYIITAEKALTLLNQASVWNTNYFPEVEDPEEEPIFENPAEALQKLARIITYACRQFITSSSAADCITSACIIPIAYSWFAQAEEDIYLGQFNTNVKGKRQLNRGMQDAAYVSIPWQANDWRRNAPYHEIYLYIPFIGNISIPASSVMGASGLTVTVSIDQTSADAIFTVSADGVTAGSITKVIGQYTANLSAQFPIGSSNVSAKSLATTIVTGVGAAAASAVAPGVGSVLAAGAAGVVGMTNSISPLPSSIGGAGGGAILSLFGYAIRCMTIYHDTNVEPSSVSAVIGTPTMAPKVLGSLTGFVQCTNAHVAIDGHLDEMTSIEDALNTGIFIE